MCQMVRVALFCKTFHDDEIKKSHGLFNRKYEIYQGKKSL